MGVRKSPMPDTHFFNLAPENLLSQRRATEKNWSTFLSNPHSNVSTRDFVQDSWQRCLRIGVNPSRIRTDGLLEDDEIKDLLERSQLYEHSVSTLEELSKQARGTAHLVTLCDSSGRILFIDGDADVAPRAEKMNFVLGSDWSESAIGTNAIGTSIVLNRPVQVFAAEHFCEGIHDWVCASAPIRDPLSNEVLGVIDVTGLWRRAQSHTLGMAVAAAQNIQFHLHRQSTRVRHHLLEEYVSAVRRYPQDGIAVLDTVGRVVEANASAIHTLIDNTTTGLFSIQEFYDGLRQRQWPSEEAEMVDIVEERLGLRFSVRPVHIQTRMIGFLLIIKRPLLHPLERPVPRKGNWETIVGESSGIRTAIAKSNIVAQSDVPILLLGESGTGKERFAHSIHKTSPRHDKPFVAINCGAIPKELLASELFGYEPGTFTGAVKAGKKGKFEEAQGGTIFLDEIGEMPMEFQVYLLRVLQEREIVRLGSAKPIRVDVRVMAATNRSLEQQIQMGTFRSDLYYRLNVVGITLPPLRDRREDIPLLIRYILHQLSDRHRNKLPALDPPVWDFLVHTYLWPGNIRELQNVLQHCVLFCGETITSDDLPPYLITMPDPELPHGTAPASNHVDVHGHQDERHLLLELLESSNGNISEVGRKLGVARSTVYRRLNKYGLLNS